MCDGRRRRLGFLATVAALLVATAFARGQATNRAPELPVISVLTFGPGREVFERFGHVAIRVRFTGDDRDYAFDWGNFSFNDPGFIARFIRGDMRYWMQGKETFGGDFPLVPPYLAADRTVIEQTLDLDSAQTLKLIRLLRTQDTDDARFYRYDYYVDNCSTRVRDAIDAAVDGQLRPQFATITDQTYRSHTRRLLQVGWDNRLMLDGIELSCGPRVDRPLSEWDAAFLPMELGKFLDRATIVGADGARRPLVSERRVLNVTTTPGNFEPATPAQPAWSTLAIGLCLAAAIEIGRRFARIVALAIAFGWLLFCAFGFAFLVCVFAFTKHWVVGWNANVLHLSPLALLAMLGIAWPRRRALARRAAAAQLAVSVAAALLAPLLAQRTLPCVALALPLHAATWHLLSSVRKPTPEPKEQAA